MKLRLKKIFKITGYILILLFVGLYILIVQFSKAKTDETILKEFEEYERSVYINHHTFEDFRYRVLATQEKIDTTLPTLVFVHGSIGSAMDFKQYLLDSTLRKRTNMISYDRIGYGVAHRGDVQESIEFEKNMLEDLIKEIDQSNVILVGYSYGGPIALASIKEYKKIVLLAPAVYSVVEPMPWALNFYKFPLTRWLMPSGWKAASKEKISHPSDLKKYEENWQMNPSEVVSVHGASDWIVPYENSTYLSEMFSPQKFELLTLPDAGHGLVWSNFFEIRKVLLEQLNY